MAAPAPIQILDTAVEVVAYQGERVVTFAMVDRVHERPEGTARRTFNDNRERFVEGEDFVTGKLDALRTAFPGAFPARGGGDVILITRRGYLKLVKPMSDDRAWAVQGEMIDRYFAPTLPARAEPAGPPAVLAAFKGFFGIGRLIGLDRNQSALAANRATASVTGVDPLALMGATHLLAPAQEHTLTATEIGRELGGRSAIAANQLLAERGLQVGKRDAKDRAYWQPTEAGMAYARLFDTGKRHGDGTPVTQVKWLRSVLDALRPAAPGEQPGAAS